LPSVAEIIVFIDPMIIADPLVDPNKFVDMDVIHQLGPCARHYRLVAGTLDADAAPYTLLLKFTLDLDTVSCK